MCPVCFTETFQRSAVHIRLGVFPIQRLNACVNADLMAESWNGGRVSPGWAPLPGEGMGRGSAVSHRRKRRQLDHISSDGPGHLNSRGLCQGQLRPALSFSSCFCGFFCFSRFLNNSRIACGADKNLRIFTKNASAWVSVLQAIPARGAGWQVGASFDRHLVAHA
jgi:hypothetical protein